MTLTIQEQQQEDLKKVEEPKYLVAILAGTYQDACDGYGDYSEEFVGHHMTDWDEVTKEEYESLVFVSHKNRKFKVLRRLNIEEVLPSSVKEYKAYVKKCGEEELKARQRAAAEKAKRNATAASRKAAKLAKLAEELGVQLVPSSSGTVGSSESDSSK